MAKKKKLNKDKREMRLTMEYVAITELKRWKKNPRINAEAAEKLCASFESHGFINPIIAYKKTKTIYAGDTRIQTAEAMGYKEVPVIFVPFDSEEAAELYAVMDNKSSEWARWNENVLQDLLSERKTLSREKIGKMSGFSKLELEGIDVDSGVNAPETFAKTIKGDKVLLEKNRLNWAWVSLPGEEEFKQLIKAGGRATDAEDNRELSFGKLFAALKLETGTPCTECDSVMGRCKKCDGTGFLPIQKVKKILKKIGG